MALTGGSRAARREAGHGPDRIQPSASAHLLGDGVSGSSPTDRAEIPGRRGVPLSYLRLSTTYPGWWLTMVGEGCGGISPLPKLQQGSHSTLEIPHRSSPFIMQRKDAGHFHEIEAS
jgi:hypothetical protein